MPREPRQKTRRPSELEELAALQQLAPQMDPAAMVQMLGSLYGIQDQMQNAPAKQAQMAAQTALAQAQTANIPVEAQATQEALRFQQEQLKQKLALDWDASQRAWSGQELANRNIGADVLQTLYGAGVTGSQTDYAYKQAMPGDIPPPPKVKPTEPTRESLGLAPVSGQLQVSTPSIAGEFGGILGKAVLDKYMRLMSIPSYLPRAAARAFTTPANQPYIWPELNWSNY